MNAGWMQPRRPQRVDRAAEPWALRYGGVIVIVIVGGLLTVAAGLAAVFWLPTIDSLVGDFSGGDLQSARADIRSSGLKLATGIGAATAGLLAWGRLDLSREEHRLDEQSKRDERFARAVELLGSDKGSVRLGALYALEALAKDGYDHQTVYDIVTAFARSNSPGRNEVGTVETVIGLERVDDMQGDVLPVFDSSDLTTDDFEAAIKICLRCQSAWKVRLNLQGVEIANRTISDLQLADFAGARFSDCRFEGGTLSGVSFVSASLTRCRFIDASLQDSRFDGAVLTSCAFRRVQVVGTLLAAAEFVECTFEAVDGDATSSTPVIEHFDGAKVPPIAREQAQG